MSVFIVAAIVLMALELGAVQPSNITTNTNTALESHCSGNEALSITSFYRNLGSTISQLRDELSKNGVYYAKAQSVENGESVYGLAQCRKYLTAAQCLGCFDDALSALKPCSSSNGAHVFLDNCYLRYENYDQFYYVPQGNLDIIVGICGNESTSQPIEALKQAVEELLSDIRVATPRTSDYYTASTMQVTSGNSTVYAIGQCMENTIQAICKDCMDSAYNNLISCPPSSEGRVVDVACFMRYSEFPFFQDNQAINLVRFLDEGSSSKHGLIVGVSIGASFLLLTLAFCLWYRRWKKSKSVGEDTTELQGGRSYSYRHLKVATNNFNEKCLLGKGGFGEVFKAIVDDGVVAAVKKLNGTGIRARKEFVNEAKVISNVRHRNLVLQLGWCVNGSDLFLVLEYMPQGSLDKFLWGEKRGNLNWQRRVDIILGIARGLAHLHNEFHVKIVHRDIKSSNILLDDDFQPKIADFGLAKFYPDDHSHVSTCFVGTMGYTSPEYATHGHLSEKVDTYSFGIVMLEVISGQRCSDPIHRGPRIEYLLDHAWHLYEKGIHFKLIDEALDPKECEEEYVMHIVEIALKCTQSPPSLRPTMSEVVLMLFSKPTSGQTQMSRPTFIDDNRRIHIDEHS